MVAAGELFTIDELRELNIIQLRRVCAYLGVDFSMVVAKNEKAQLINKILEFQHPKDPEINWDGNPDWKPGVQRSARVQRLYELNVLKKKL